MVGCYQQTGNSNRWDPDKLHKPVIQLTAENLISKKDGKRLKFSTLIKIYLGRSSSLLKPGIED